MSPARRHVSLGVIWSFMVSMIGCGPSFTSIRSIEEAPKGAPIVVVTNDNDKYKLTDWRIEGDVLLCSGERWMPEGSQGGGAFQPFSGMIKKTEIRYVAVQDGSAALGFDPALVIPGAIFALVALIILTWLAGPVHVPYE